MPEINAAVLPPEIEPGKGNKCRRCRSSRVHESRRATLGLQRSRALGRQRWRAPWPANGQEPLASKWSRAPWPAKWSRALGLQRSRAIGLQQVKSPVKSPWAPKWSRAPPWHKWPEPSRPLSSSPRKTLAAARQGEPRRPFRAPAGLCASRPALTAASIESPRWQSQTAPGTRRTRQSRRDTWRRPWRQCTPAPSPL